MLTRREMLAGVGAGMFAGVPTGFHASPRRFPWGSSVFDRLGAAGVRLGVREVKDSRGSPSPYWSIACAPRGAEDGVHWPVVADGIEAMGVAFADRVEAMIEAGSFGTENTLFWAGKYLLLDYASTVTDPEGWTIGKEHPSGWVEGHFLFRVRLDVRFATWKPEGFKEAPGMPFDPAMERFIVELRDRRDTEPVGKFGMPPVMTPAMVFLDGTFLGEDADPEFHGHFARGPLS